MRAARTGGAPRGNTVCPEAGDGGAAPLVLCRAAPQAMACHIIMTLPTPKTKTKSWCRSSLPHLVDVVSLRAPTVRLRVPDLPRREVQRVRRRLQLRDGTLRDAQRCAVCMTLCTVYCSGADRGAAG